jgi:hypothetical protein
MLMFSNHLRPVAFIAAGVLMLALAQFKNAQGCHGGMGGGYMGGGGYSGGGYSGSGYSGGTTDGYYRQGSSGSGSQYYAGMQQTVTSSANASLNNPATVLANQSVLNLTGKQVTALEKMLTTGKQHAVLVLTPAQRKQLAQMVGVVSK